MSLSKPSVLPATFRAAVEEVAFTGRVVYIGYAKEPVSYETRFFVQKELDIIGSRNALPEDFRAVIEMLQQRAFPVHQAISKFVPLSDAGTALEEWSANPTKFRKIVVRDGLIIALNCLLYRRIYDCRGARLRSDKSKIRDEYVAA